MYFSLWVTQGGARASLTLGYFLEPRTGFSVGAPARAGSLRRGGTGGRVCAAAGGARVRCWPPLPLPPLLRGVGEGGCIFRRGVPRVALVPR